MKTSPFAKRPGYSTSGRAAKVRVNQFRVESLGSKKVWQYDVSDAAPGLGEINC